MCLGYVLQTESGLVYVGITNDLKRRLREHRNFGPLKGLSLRVLNTKQFPGREQAAAWEVSEIERRGGVEVLINRSTGGHGGRGRKWTPEMRAALSEKKKIQQADPDFRKRMSVSCKKAWADPKLRLGLSERTKLSCADPAVKAKRSVSQKKSWLRETTRRARVEKITEAARTQEGRQSRREAQLRRWHG